MMSNKYSMSGLLMETTGSGRVLTCPPFQFSVEGRKIYQQISALQIQIHKSIDHGLHRDEARRAKSIAEDMLDRKEYFVAEKWARKAQMLYPELEGISQLLAVLRVYVSAEKKICGETDWYEVLHVNPSDDDESIKRQYRKLALALHPDKNKSVGAHGAFIIMSEAWTFLSDKENRLVYDIRRRAYSEFQQNVGTHSAVPSAPPMPSQHPAPTDTGDSPSVPCGPSQQDVPDHTASEPSPSPFSNSGSKRRTPAPMPQGRRPRVFKPTSSSSHQSSDTFWTICHQCRLRFEHLRIYHNCILGCLNCYTPFLASEAAPPTNCGESDRPSGFKVDFDLNVSWTEECSWS